MYEIIKNVIQSGRYELADMLRKIDTVWLQGDILEDQRAELAGLARERAVPENSYASVQKQLDNIYGKLAELAERLLALEGGGIPLDEYPEYIQPTGAYDAYKAGDKITYNGGHYVCQMDGCVWTPDVYPDAWQPVN